MQLRDLLLKPDPSTGRVVWVDNGKALLIVLVVYGHFGMLWPIIDVVGNAFHIPGFLFLTGFMLSRPIENVKLQDFLARYIYPYVRLYLFLSAMAICVWWALDIQTFENFDLLGKATWQALYGTQAANDRFLHGNGPLWYLPFFVTSLVALYVAMKLPLVLRFLLVAAFYLFTFHYHGPRLPWAIDATGVGLLFISAGLGLRRSLTGRLGSVEIRRWMIPAFSVVAVIAFVLFAVLNGKSNINIMLFGRSSVLYLVATFLGIASVASVCLMMPATQLANILSNHSLIIFGIHIYAVREINALLAAAPSLLTQALLPVFALLIAIACALVSLAAKPWLDRYVLRRPVKARDRATQSLAA